MNRLNKLFLLIVLSISLGVVANGINMNKMTVQEVKSQHVTQIMAIPGVVSMGIGRNSQGESVIVIGVVSDKTSIISALPTELDGYKVEHHVIGSVKTQELPKK